MDKPVSLNLSRSLPRQELKRSSNCPVLVASPFQTAKPVVARSVQKLRRKDPTLAASRRLQELLAQIANPVLLVRWQRSGRYCNSSIDIAGVWHRDCPPSNLRRDATDPGRSHHETVSKSNTPDLSERVQQQLKLTLRRYSVDVATLIFDALARDNLKTTVASEWLQVARSGFCFEFLLARLDVHISFEKKCFFECLDSGSKWLYIGFVKTYIRFFNTLMGMTVQFSQSRTSVRDTSNFLILSISNATRFRT